jgi:hypothetical protein
MLTRIDRERDAPGVAEDLCTVEPHGHGRGVRILRHDDQQSWNPRRHHLDALAREVCAILSPVSLGKTQYRVELRPRVGELALLLVTDREINAGRFGCGARGLQEARPQGSTPRLDPEVDPETDEPPPSSSSVSSSDSESEVASTKGNETTNRLRRWAKGSKKTDK